MEPQKTGTSEREINGFDLVLIVLSIYVLLALIVETLFPLSQDTRVLLQWFDAAICAVFLWDFFLRFTRAPDKWKFMKWGWIDFISSIPALDMFRWGRVVRLVRLFRILRAIRSARLLATVLLRNRAENTFVTVSLLSALFLIFSTIAILQFESSAESNIKSAPDALWWSLSTITTVGYGDRFPVTPEGRIVAGLLMITGVGMFGTFTATLASLFVKQEPDRTGDLVLEKLAILEQRLMAIEARLGGKVTSDE